VTGTSYTDTTAASGTTYYYTVEAVDAAGSSGASNEAVATPVAVGSSDVLTGLVHRYTLNGNTLDSVGADNGTAGNGPTYVAGRGGQEAISLNGTNQYVDVPDTADLDVSATQSFTISAWVNLSNLSNSWPAVFSKSRSASTWYGVWLGTSNDWCFNGQSGDADSSTAPAAGIWYLVTAVQDGMAGTRTLYVNGTAVATGTAQAANATGDFDIGGASANGNYLPGLIQDVRVYNRALSSTEVMAVMDAPIAPAAPTNLAASTASGQVALTWAASTGATGYNVYRGTAAGQESTIPLNSSTLTGTSYTDTTVTNGTTYYYVVKAVDSAGSSAASNEVTATPAAASVDVLTGLVHRYTLNGNTLDSVGTDNGKAVNGPTYVAGKVGEAMSFNGTNQYVDVPNTANLQFSKTQSFTLSAWVNLSSLPNHWTGIVTKSRSTSPWYGIWLNPSHRWSFSGAASNTVSSTTATTGVWYLVTAVQNGTAGTRTLYVNGTAVATGKAQAANGSGDLWIGGAQGESEYFPGVIDDVRIYNVALSAAQVGDVFTAGGGSTASTNLTAGPMATLTANNVSSAGGTTTFTVNYSDAVPIRAATVKGEDILVTGPNGFCQLATLVSANTKTDAASVTATYRIKAPGGKWEAKDDGVYTIRVLKNRVKDAKGRAVPAGALGSFSVGVTSAALADSVFKNYGL
jgi:hypothetical protein